MYPFARAFGGEKESQLKISREAFAAMKAGLEAGSVIVFAPLVVRGGDKAWDPETARHEVATLQRILLPKAALASQTPEVPFEPMGANQLRWVRDRGRLYAGWVGTTRPAGDYFFFTEVLTDGNGARILAAHLYVVDASGRLAYESLANSHHFDPGSFRDAGGMIDWVLERFKKDLQEEPTEIFPPYGVG